MKKIHMNVCMKNEVSFMYELQRNYKLFSPPSPPPFFSQNTATMMEMEAEICERKMKYISDISSKFFGSQVI